MKEVPPVREGAAVLLDESDWESRASFFRCLADGATC